MNGVARRVRRRRWPSRTEFVTSLGQCSPCCGRVGRRRPPAVSCQGDLGGRGGFNPPPDCQNGRSSSEASIKNLVGGAVAELEERDRGTVAAADLRGTRRRIGGDRGRSGWSEIPGCRDRAAPGAPGWIAPGGCPVWDPGGGWRTQGGWGPSPWGDGYPQGNRSGVAPRCRTNGDRGRRPRYQDPGHELRLALGAPGCSAPGGSPSRRPGPTWEILGGDLTPTWGQP